MVGLRSALDLAHFFFAIVYFCSMAVIKKGILGGLKGGVGNVVGVTIKGRHIVRGSKSSLSDKSKVIAQPQIERFELVNTFLLQYGYLFKIGLDYFGLDSSNIKQMIVKGQKDLVLTTYLKGFENGCMYQNHQIKPIMQDVSYDLSYNRLQVWYKVRNFTDYLPNDWFIEGLWLNQSLGLHRVYIKAFPTSTYRIITGNLGATPVGENLLMVRMFSPTLGQIGNVWFCTKFG